MQYEKMQYEKNYDDKPKIKQKPIVIVKNNIKDKISRKKLKKYGKLYIRGNGFSFNNMSAFNQVFRLTENSKKKTIQNITNCYQEENPSRRGPGDPLDLSDFRGIFPCLEFNISSGIEKPIERIKKQIGESKKAESYMLFLTEENPSISSTDDDNNEISIIESFKDNGLIKSNCQIKLYGDLEHLSSEFIITPNFNGIIVCIQDNYEGNDIFKDLLDNIRGDKKTNLKNLKKIFDDIKKAVVDITFGSKSKKKRQDDTVINDRQIEKSRSRSHNSSGSGSGSSSGSSKKGKKTGSGKTKKKSRMGRSPHKR